MLQDQLAVTPSVDEENDPKGEAGQAMVEYVILISVIAAFLTVLYTTYTAAVRNFFTYLSHVWMAPVP